MYNMTWVSDALWNTS